MLGSGRRVQWVSGVAGLGRGEQMNNIEAFCRYEDYANRVNIYIFRNLPNGGREFCVDINTQEFKPYTEGFFIEKPTISIMGRLARPFLQAIADALPDIGIKPKGQPILEDEMSAIKYHLEDMRCIAFNKKPKV